LVYEIPVSTGAQGKISVSSFLPFSTASVTNGRPAMSASRPLLTDAVEKVQNELIEKFRGASV
jgi:hypothetical protein